MKLVLFVKKEFNYLMDAADLTDNGTKVFGDYVILTVEKEGDLNKLVKDRIVAAYCNGKSKVADGIKSLSDGQHFIAVSEFEKRCKVLVCPHTNLINSDDEKCNVCGALSF